MPRRPRRPCPQLGCPRFRPCPLHPATSYRGSSTAQGYGARWRAISARVLAEEPVCPGYERPCGDPTEVVDHIQARRRGGTDDRANLRAYCRACHSRKTVAEDGGWLAQANALLDAAKGHQFEAIFQLAVYLGMRQGEILGLLWKNIDFERGAIRIFGQLQSEPGRPRGESLVVNERPKWGSDRTIGVPAETSFVLRPCARTASASASSVSLPVPAAG